ncbi:MAG TPA: hypothetical protein VHW71_03060 [Steroidobacteraceae bacterium]|jgi:hypothetical protein|nr:hypothetical protein [Steroidobacteraceae bacterium]
MPSSLLEPYRHQAYIPARRALDALIGLQRKLAGDSAATLGAARIGKILPELSAYVATLRRADAEHLGEYARVVWIIAALSAIQSDSLDSIIGDLEHSRTEIGNA